MRGNGGGGDDEVRKDAARAGSGDVESLRDQSIVEGTALHASGRRECGSLPAGYKVIESEEIAHWLGLLHQLFNWPVCPWPLYHRSSARHQTPKVLVT